MITPLLYLLSQAPEVHYKGGASGTTVEGVNTVAKLFRFLFSTVPQWVQLAGILIGGPLALIVAWQCWKHRQQIIGWFKAKSRLYKMLLVGSVGVVGLAGGGTGLVGYNYMMTNNDFCQSCHVMDTAWNRFQASAHKELQCHACHRQSIFVSSIELYWWVTERRMAVPAHDKVPTKICTECHMRAQTDSTRTNVLKSAGHLVHLKSDSSALKNVQCVSCHGRDFHLFRPNNSTCMQSGCHTDKRIKLGVMSDQGFMHCTVCHAFRGKVADSSTVKQGEQRLAPNATQCTSCHEMSDKFSKYNFAADPHKGGCGSCHNPHKQVEPKESYKTCATAQCHANADTLTAFHRGLGGHALEDCGTCHKPHTWKVQGTQCLDCHKTIYQDRPSLRHLLKPSRASAKTASAMTQAGPSTVLLASDPSRRLSHRSPRRALHRALHRAATVANASWVQQAPAPTVKPAAPSASQATIPPAAPADTATFPHSRHKSVKCAECHGAGDYHGQLKFTAPDGCRGCHHAAAQKSACAKCHATAPKPRDVSVTLNVTPRKAPVTRGLPFRHEVHGKLECAKCHGTDANKTVVQSCTSCHAEHHAAARDCTSCHTGAQKGHDRASHESCTSCHTGAKSAALTLTRALCLTCHEKQKTHEPGGNCAACHAISSHATGGRN